MSETKTQFVKLARTRTHNEGGDINQKIERTVVDYIAVNSISHVSFDADFGKISITANGEETDYNAEINQEFLQLFKRKIILVHDVDFSFS